MQKSLTILVALFTATFSCAPAYSQQLSFDQMIRMTGGNQAYLPALQAQYNRRGLPVTVSTSSNPAVGFGFAGTGGETAGDSGDYGNQSSDSYTMANDFNTVSNYGGDTANQSPYSREVLPQTNTALQSLEGGFGRQFGTTSFPSGSHYFGFANSPEIPYRGVSGTKAIRGRNLPRVSTASADIDIVDKGPAHGDWELQIYKPSYEAVMAIRRAKARG
ncbi:MAG: hypothetical protein IT342_00595, partial [Candidatus Melainabacteria bacterium]|nr:hypothetical protein [Candidatus Melainabacteria bacterium]